jgi:hypothetical protein
MILYNSLYIRIDRGYKQSEIILLKSPFCIFGLFFIEHFSEIEENILCIIIFPKVTINLI